MFVYMGLSPLKGHVIFGKPQKGLVVDFASEFDLVDLNLVSECKNTSKKWENRRFKVQGSSSMKTKMASGLNFLRNEKFRLGCQVERLFQRTLSPTVGVNVQLSIDYSVRSPPKKRCSNVGM